MLSISLKKEVEADMSKHDEKPLQISITFSKKYIERLLFVILLCSHVVPFDIEAWEKVERDYKDLPKRCFQYEVAVSQEHYEKN